MKALSSQSRITDVDAVSDALIGLYQHSTIENDAYLAQIMQEIQKLSADLTAAIKRSKTYSALEDADTVRDQLIKDLGDAITGYAAIRVPHIKDAAAILLPIYNKYGKEITKESYNRESSLIESMLGDFEQEPAREATFRLEGVRELIDDLRRAQNRFAAANEAYTKATSTKEISATAYRKPLITAINGDLVPYLAAMGKAQPERYGAFAADVEREIVRANSGIGRKGKDAAGEAEEEKAE